MAAKRKKWATSIRPGLRTSHQSQAAAYRKVAFYAEQYAAGMLSGSQVAVWVDEGAGRGWELFETVTLSDLAGPTSTNGS